MIRLIPIYLILMLSLVCCKGREERSADDRVVKDDLGRTIHVKSSPSKVMALSSSITEMLFLICPDSQIVGRTHNCDYPPAALAKPVVNNYPIDYERLLMLKPDVVFAKDGIISAEEASKVEMMGIPVYFQHYDNMEDVFEGIEEIGRVLDRNERARQVADSLRKALEAVKRSVKKEKVPKVLLVITLDKIFVFGRNSFASDMLEAAGGINAMDRNFNNAFPQINSEYLLQIDPDIIIVPDRLKEDIRMLYPELKNVKAIRNRKVFTIPEDMISRPGPRVVETVKFLNKIIQSHEG